MKLLINNEISIIGFPEFMIVEFEYFHKVHTIQSLRTDEEIVVYEQKITFDEPYMCPFLELLDDCWNAYDVRGWNGDFTYEIMPDHLVLVADK